jgi:glycerophosphoryl diester phosphodiesterase
VTRTSSLLPALAALAAIGFAAPACSGGSPARADAAAAPDGAASDGGAPDGQVAGDAGSPFDGGPDGSVPAPDGGTYRTSLSVCWTDATCPRVMAIGHGGAWNASNAPYDSNAAIAAAYATGMEGVKIDVRVTADDVPVIAHSSPIQLYESVDCYNKVIESITAAEVTACHRFPSSTETFQRLDDVLGYLRGKMVAQLTVKRSQDYARTIAQIHGSGAEDFTFMEISTSELQTLIPTLPGSGSVWYLVNVASNLAEIDTLLNTIQNPRAFMYEMDSTVSLGTLVTARLHPAGVRAFTYDSSATASAAELKALFDSGYDVVSAQTGANDVQARIQVNTARGVSPP